MHIAEVVSGLVAQDDFNRADSELCDGVIWKGASPSGFAVAGNVVVDTPDLPGTSKYARYDNGIAALGELVVEADLRSDAVAVRANALINVVDPAAIGASRYALLVRSATGPSNGRLIFQKTVGSVDTTVVTDSTQLIDGGTLYACKLWIKPSQQKAWFNGYLFADQVLTDLNAKTFVPGFGRNVGAGVSPGAGVVVDNWAAYKGNTVVMTGLPTGWKLQIDALTAVVEVGGTATFSFDGTSSRGRSTVKVLDAADNVIQTLSPANGVWGGGQYEFIGVATHLGFSVQPMDANEGAVLAAVSVVALDDDEDVSALFTGDITLALFGPPATLSGTTPVAAVAGQSDFGDLSIDNAGTDYTLVATAAGLTQAVSDPFDIIQVPVDMAFTTQPVGELRGATMGAVVVTVRDHNGFTVLDYTGDVTLALLDPPDGAVLSGTLTKAAVAGVATFDDLVVDGHSGAMTLEASAALPTPTVDSDPFDVLPFWTQVAAPGETVWSAPAAVGETAWTAPAAINSPWSQGG